MVHAHYASLKQLVVYAQRFVVYQIRIGLGPCGSAEEGNSPKQAGDGILLIIGQVEARSKRIGRHDAFLGEKDEGDIVASHRPLVELQHQMTAPNIYPTSTLNRESKLPLRRLYLSVIFVSTDAGYRERCEPTSKRGRQQGTRGRVDQSWQ